MTAIYTKLRSGDWGLKITEDEVCEGEIVVVRKKNGSTNYETIGKIIYECGSYTICTIIKPSQSGNYSELKEREGHYDNKPVPYPYHEQYIDNAKDFWI